MKIYDELNKHKINRFKKHTLIGLYIAEFSHLSKKVIETENNYHVNYLITIFLVITVLSVLIFNK